MLPLYVIFDINKKRIKRTQMEITPNMLGLLGFQSLVMFLCAIIKGFPSYMYEGL